MNTVLDLNLKAAWAWQNGWAESTIGDRTRHHHDEDAAFVAAGLLYLLRKPKGDYFIGREIFTALNDCVEIELYDPRRVVHGTVAQRIDGMPMVGHLAARRCFEDTTSLAHIGADGELYRSRGEPGLVSAPPMDRDTKLATFAYYETRVKAMASAIHQMKTSA